MMLFKRSNMPVDATVQVGPFKLKAPAEHMLAQYQADHPLYDRFPIFVTSCLPAGAVIDIGANIGDTAAAFASAGPRTIICAEPGESFFPYLEHNAEQLRAANHIIHCEKVAIGPADRQGAWVTTSSTARLSAEGDGGIEFISLDMLADQLDLFKLGVAIVKCDVDGFDGAALLSGRRLISKLRPLIYFENQITSESSATDLKALYEFLQANGYESFGVFDNFGAPMLKTDSTAAVLDLVDYVTLQDAGLSTRGIYYVDVIASADVELFDRIWKGYGRFARGEKA